MRLPYRSAVSRSRRRSAASSSGALPSARCVVGGGALAVGGQRRRRWRPPRWRPRRRARPGGGGRRRWRPRARCGRVFGVGRAGRRRWRRPRLGLASAQLLLLGVQAGRMTGRSWAGPRMVRTSCRWCRSGCGCSRHAAGPGRPPAARWPVPADAADDPVELGGGAVPGQLDPVDAVVGLGDAGDRADLGVRHPAVGEGGGDRRAGPPGGGRRGPGRGRCRASCRCARTASGRRTACPVRPSPHAGRTRRSRSAARPARRRSALRAGRSRRPARPATARQGSSCTRHHRRRRATASQPCPQPSGTVTKVPGGAAARRPTVEGMTTTTYGARSSPGRSAWRCCRRSTSAGSSAPRVRCPPWSCPSASARSAPDSSSGRRPAARSPAVGRRRVVALQADDVDAVRRAAGASRSSARPGRCATPWSCAGSRRCRCPRVGSGDRSTVRRRRARHRHRPADRRARRGAAGRLSAGSATRLSAPAQRPSLSARLSARLSAPAQRPGSAPRLSAPAQRPQPRRRRRPR